MYKVLPAAVLSPPLSHFESPNGVVVSRDNAGRSKNVVGLNSSVCIWLLSARGHITRAPNGEGYALSGLS